jgi:predicted TIM-barrel fold metal-dependent hydrolase
MTHGERLSRREAIRAVAVAGGGLVAAPLVGGPSVAGRDPPGAAPAEKSATEIASGSIDAHVHVWTPDTAKYPLAAGYRRDEMKPASFTPQELLALARPCGVARVVLVQMSFYGFDNSYLLDSIRAHPGVFSGIAVIDEQAVRPQDAMRRLKARGVRGFRIYPRNLPVDRWLDSPGMAAMWECGAAEGLAMCCLVNPDALSAIDRQCGKFPDTTLVIDHFARIGADGQMREADLKRLCGLARHKHARVKVSAFYALGNKRSPYLDLSPMIRRLLEAFGPQRLMWASDCPFQVQDGHTYRDSVELIEKRLDFLTADDRQWLLRKTAQRVFFS